MTNQDNSMGQMGNVPMNNEPAMPLMTQPFTQMAEMPETDTTLTNQAVYPEVYYKLKPYISMACDLMDTYGIDVPTQQQLDDMTDGIYDDFCDMYPDMAKYMSKTDADNDPPDDPPPFRGGFRGGFRPGFRFRRRGLGRDFISALLLAELFGRGGFIF